MAYPFLLPPGSWLPRAGCSWWEMTVPTSQMKKNQGSGRTSNFPKVSGLLRVELGR